MTCLAIEFTSHLLQVYSFFSHDFLVTDLCRAFLHLQVALLWTCNSRTSDLCKENEVFDYVFHGFSDFPITAFYSTYGNKSRLIALLGFQSHHYNLALHSTHFLLHISSGQLTNMYTEMFVSVCRQAFPILRCVQDFHGRYPRPFGCHRGGFLPPYRLFTASISDRWCHRIPSVLSRRKPYIS